MLNRHRKITHPRHRFFDMGCPEDSFADFHALVKQRLVGFLDIV
jgi:hypothetical protein